ncbi:MAG TPA: hypothetical protein VF017_07480 [Thermoanaerobaculia bacterium]|nr:hypothetical protein [Thermoanaerobaculia bacterium]
MRRSSLVAILLALAGLAPAALADQRQVALGAEGELFRVEAGPLRQLFPGAAEDDRTALALSIARPGQPVQRLLVPDTEGEESESSPALFYEESSEALYLIWESRINFIHSQVRLISYTAGYWSRAIDLTGTFFSFKASPSLAVTRDTFSTLDDDGNPVQHRRTIYHALWWEESGSGERVVYSPVVLVDGVYIGWNPLLVLNDLGLGVPGDSLPSTVELARAPTVQPGKDGSSVVVAMIDSRTSQLVELDVSPIAGELAAVSHAVAQDLSVQGQTGGPVGTAALGERVRVQLVDFGLRFRMHPGLLAVLGGVAQTELNDPANASLSAPELAEKVRVQLVDFGWKMDFQGLGQARDLLGSWLFEFPCANPASVTKDGPASPLHSISVRLASVHPTPSTEPAPTTVHPSRSGAAAIVAWQVGSELRYRESMTDGWSEVRSLVLDTNLDLAAAHSILEQKVRDR